MAPWRHKAAHVGAPLVWNKNHPMKTVAALRLLIAVGPTDRPALTHALFKAYWEGNRNVADEAELRAILDGLGLPWPPLADVAAARDQLRRNTGRFVAMGAFGVPCFLVGGRSRRFFWGQDRLFLVQRALGLSQASPRRSPTLPATHGKHTLEIFFDFSSPWSYLGSLQVQGVVEQAGAALVYKPVLLGALFKEIGTPVEPMRALAPARSSYFRCCSSPPTPPASACLPACLHACLPPRSMSALSAASGPNGGEQIARCLLSPPPSLSLSLSLIAHARRHAHNTLFACLSACRLLCVSSSGRGPRVPMTTPSRLPQWRGWRDSGVHCGAVSVSEPGDLWQANVSRTCT
eukprot:jgi/Mesen1/7055/ME000369S06380